MHVSKNAVSKWERGLNLPDVSLMEELCQVLKISLNELFAGEYLKKQDILEQSEKNILSIRDFISISLGIATIAISFLAFVFSRESLNSVLSNEINIG